MKITYDLPPDAERDLTLLAAKFGSMENACCSALSVGCAMLLKHQALVEEVKRKVYPEKKENN